MCARSNSLCQRKCLWFAHHLIGFTLGLCIPKFPRKCSVQLSNWKSLFTTTGSPVQWSSRASPNSDKTGEQVFVQLDYCRSPVQFQRETSEQHHQHTARSKQALKQLLNRLKSQWPSLLAQMLLLKPLVLSLPVGGRVPRPGSGLTVIEHLRSG